METASSSYSRTLRASFVAPWCCMIASELWALKYLQYPAVPPWMKPISTYPTWTMPWWASCLQYTLLEYWCCQKIMAHAGLGVVWNFGRPISIISIFPRGAGKVGSWGLILPPVLCGGSWALLWSAAGPWVFRDFSPLADERTEGCCREPLADDGTQGCQKRAARSRWVPEKDGAVSLWGLDGSHYCLFVCIYLALLLPLK